MSQSSQVQPNTAETSTEEHNLRNLQQWSCINKQLPSASSIGQIHIYDFDNTLFGSPLPNKQLWNGASIGILQSQDLVNGGWWHDSSILACTGEGIEKEEPRAWLGWWNEKIVELVQLSMQQRDALTVLLTGRSEAAFTNLILRILRSKGLEFDIICLKPLTGPSKQKFASTLKFKQTFLEQLIRAYRAAGDLRIYEDRIKHVEAFRDFFTNLNEILKEEVGPKARRPIKYDVVEVSEEIHSLDPVTEVKEVQRMLNAHNEAVLNGAAPKFTKPRQIKRTVLYTGYLISPADTVRLINLLDKPRVLGTGDVRTLANNVMITPRPCPQNILKKVGGFGKKFRWRVVALGSLDDKVWAARVEPIPHAATFHTENSTPYIVLAVRNMGRPLDAARITHWSPLADDKVFELESVVGEKVLLRIEEERTDDLADAQNAAFNQRSSGQKRPKPYDEDFPALGSQSHNHNPKNNENRNSLHHSNQHGNSRPSGPTNSGLGGNGGRAGKAGANGRNEVRQARGMGKGSGRQRGRNNPYRSLDDINLRSHQYPGSMDGAGDDGGLTY